MLAGEPYYASDEELTNDRRKLRNLLEKFNRSLNFQDEQQVNLLREILGAMGNDVTIQAPFYCDYGYNIFLGDRVYFNFNCVVLDVCKVKIGSDTMFGPHVQIYSATHSMDAQERASGRELGKPVSIGDHVWVGGSAIICPGVTIGNGAVIGAGSVVTRSIPPHVFAAGNPCQVIRPLGSLIL